MRTILLLLFSFVFLNASANPVEPCSQGAAPSWVQANDFPLNNIPPKPSQINSQYLLIDTQRNVEEKTRYCHFAIKTLTQSGIESVSQISIDFDPSSTQVVMHDIRVFREGAWHDRLESARHNLIQRETELEQNLYNGDLTLVYFLNDIREGDIVEYAYSLVGDSPLALLRYTDWVYMQRGSTVEKMTHRLLANPGLTFSTKLIDSERIPLIRDLSPHIREWIWESSETPAYVEEQNQPVWYNPPAILQMSEYGSWQEVVQHILPFYDLPGDFCSQEMEDLIAGWQKASPNLCSQALCALRFVQDEIRYLGFEDGMRAFKPRDPATTLKRRFGDCKDKTFLLHALLKSMGISSKPVFVHTTRGKILPDALPTPFAFNHVVLQLEIANTTYFADPTWSLQGGSLEKNFFPDYDWGLVLAKNTSALTPLPKQALENPTEIDSEFIVIQEDAAHLKIKSTFYGTHADRMRRFLKWRGLEKISQNKLFQMQDIYGTASLREVMDSSDDRENNIITFIESYTLPTRDVQDQKKLDLLSHTLRNYLYSSINPQRSSPYEISYPLWVKERIQIETPYIEWTPYRDNCTKSHEAFFYSSSMEVDKHRACFHFELKHLQDHIPKYALHSAWQIMNDISRSGLPCITVAISRGSFLDFSLLLLASFSALIIWIPAYLVSRTKRATQDALSFHLRKFQVLYILLNAFSLMALGSESSSVILPVILIPVAVTQFIFIKRSARLVLIVQGCLILQACIIGLLLFTNMPNVHIGHKFIAISIYCVYSAFILKALNKAKGYLNQERSLAKCS